MSIANLSRETGINRETLRRDVEALHGLGVLTRHEGKVHLNESTASRRRISAYGVLTREERLQDLERLVNDKGFVRVARLSQLLNVTTTTIRADLKRLEISGIVELHHGYVSSKTANPFLDPGTPEPFESHIKVVSLRAIEHIESGDIVFLDGSTFSYGIAEEIDRTRHVTVLTNSVRVASNLMAREAAAEVVTVSGRWISAAGSLHPVSIGSVFDQFKVKKAFLGVSSLFGNQRIAFEDVATKEDILTVAHSSEQLFLCSRSDSFSKRVGQSRLICFDDLKDKIAELIVDDTLDCDLARSVLPTDLPVVLCGTDYTYHLRTNKGKRVGLSVFPGSSDFRQEVCEGIEHICNRNPSYTLYTRHNNGDYETIVDNFNRLIADEVDVLIDYSTNYEVGVLIAQKAADLRIPLITVDLPVQNAVYFGANNVLAGRIAGEHASDWVHEAWRGNVDTIFALVRDTAGSVCQQRVLGSIDALRSRVAFNPKGVKHIDCSRGFSYYQNKLQLHLDRMKPDSRCLVFSFAEDITADIHALIRDYAQDRQIVMVGQNYSYHIEQLMKTDDSPLIGCVSYHQDHYGGRLMEIATRLMEGDAVEAVNYTDHVWIPNLRRNSLRNAGEVTQSR